MGRFKDLIEGKEKEVVINNEKFIIKPLTGKHIGTLFNTNNVSDSENMLNIVYLTLHNSDETITMEDVSELPVSDLMRLMSEITELNELDKLK